MGAAVVDTVTGTVSVATSSSEQPTNRSPAAPNTANVRLIPSIEASQPPTAPHLCPLDPNAEVVSLNGDNYRLKDRDLERVPTDNTTGTAR
jgi:hypothetical protein